VAGVNDALLVVETEEEIFEMNNGCVCCTIRGDLMRILSPPRYENECVEQLAFADRGTVVGRRAHPVRQPVR